MLCDSTHQHADLSFYGLSMTMAYAIAIPWLYTPWYILTKQ